MLNARHSRNAVPRRSVSTALPPLPAGRAAAALRVKSADSGVRESWACVSAGTTGSGTGLSIHARVLLLLLLVVTSERNSNQIREIKQYLTLKAVQTMKMILSFIHHLLSSCRWLPIFSCPRSLFPSLNNRRFSFKSEPKPASRGYQPHGPQSSTTEADRWPPGPRDKGRAWGEDVSQRGPLAHCAKICRDLAG